MTDVRPKLKVNYDPPPAMTLLERNMHLETRIDELRWELHWALKAARAWKRAAKIERRYVLAMAFHGSWRCRWFKRREYSDLGGVE